MQYLDVNGVSYDVKRIFPFERIKDENALFKIKYAYNADYLIKDNINKRYILANKIDDAVILEETEN
jgi:hypothetical protein